MLRQTLRSIRRRIFSDVQWAKLRNWRRYELVMGPFSYNQDGLASWHNCDFMRDPKFVKAYKLGKDTRSWGISDIPWRGYVLCWAAQKGMALNGDFVECGTNRGGFARMIIDYVDFDKDPRNFYLLDTFSGLVETLLTEEEKRFGRRGGGYEECYEDVKRTFAPFPNVKIIRGTVPETLAQANTDRVAFMSIDMNCVAPEIAAAEYFWDRLVSGAVIVLDDYGWPGHIEQKKAFDHFAAKRGVLVLPLPTGQGLIVKP